MTMQALATVGVGDPGLMPRRPDKDVKSRLGAFMRWMRSEQADWHDPDLAAYRDRLLADGKAPSTVSAHLSTVRARYGALIKSNGTRDRLYSMAPADATASDRKAWVDEILTRLQNAVDPDTARVKTKTVQDSPDAAHLRLTRAQAEALMNSPGVGTLQGLRDTAVIALMLASGIRESELSALRVEDLRQRLGGELALHVREGKGCKERLIPYGELSWVLAVVDAWLDAAGISEGYAFRGFYKGGHRVRSGRLSVRAIQYIVTRYPVMVDGELVTAHPHDMRRTYARRLYEAGVPLVAIQQNLGHADVKTTLGYIGELDAEQRRAPAVYTFDLGKLARQGKLALAG